MEEKIVKEKKAFWKDGKNIVIIILSFLLLCFILSSDSLEQYKRTINELNSQIKELNITLENKENKITILQEEKFKIETERQELTTKVEELQQTSSLQTATSSTDNSTFLREEETEKMVWVGETGTKYHRQNCRTLKGNGHQITLSQALSEGRQPCKVCY